MITCNLVGGLGNQLFMIFNTISCSIESNNQFNFLNLKLLKSGNATIRHTYWESFLIELKQFLINDIPKTIIHINEKCFKYNSLPYKNMKNKNCMVNGYFQSYKYFEKNYKKICELINLDKIKRNLLLKLNLDTNYFDNSVSIHFRIGDYKKLLQFHPILTEKYYINAINLIKSKTEKPLKFFYFCEENDLLEVMEIIKILENKFPNNKFIRLGDKLKDWEQMLLMSFCKNNIIANSTFSWWGAYFNSNINKIVCYPSVWFGPKLINHNTNDLFPTDWMKINF